MAQQVQVIEGTWEEIMAHAERYSGKRLRLQILSDNLSHAENGEAAPQPGTTRVTFGMFPQLNDLTEEDFRRAEWRGEGLDDL